MTAPSPAVLSMPCLALPRGSSAFLTGNGDATAVTSVIFFFFLFFFLSRCFFPLLINIFLYWLQNTLFFFIATALSALKTIHRHHNHYCPPASRRCVFKCLWWLPITKSIINYIISMQSFTCRFIGYYDIFLFVIVSRYDLQVLQRVFPVRKWKENEVLKEQTLIFQ